MLQLLAPYAAAEGIRKDTGVVAWLRWPSWATVDRKVLAEGSAIVSRARGRTCVVIQSRVNCSSPASSDSTSLLDILGVKVDKALLSQRILDSVWWTYSAWLRGMDRTIRERIEPTLEEIGNQVTVDSRGRGQSALATGLGYDGSLLLEADGRNLKLGVGAAGRVRR
jgi:biotin-(acetyl-CoA carboxylase) ligase